MDDFSWLKMNEKRSIILWRTIAAMYLAILVLSFGISASVSGATSTTPDELTAGSAMWFLVYATTALVGVCGTTFIAIDAQYSGKGPDATKLQLIINVLITIWSVIAAVYYGSALQFFQTFSPDSTMIFALVSAAALMLTSIMIGGIVIRSYCLDRRSWQAFIASNTGFGEEPLSFREYCQVCGRN